MLFIKKKASLKSDEVLKKYPYLQLLIHRKIYKMSVKEKVLSDIQSIDNQHFLNQIQMFVSLFKQQSKKGNKDAVLAFAGMLSDEDAAEMQKTVSEEFSKIEGDWS